MGTGHVLRKDDDDWVKKCMEYEVEGPRPRGRPKRTWREVVREDCQAHKLNTEDAMDRSKWRKLMKDVRWPGWAWEFLLVPAYLGCPGPTAVKWLCVRAEQPSIHTRWYIVGGTNCLKLFKQSLQINGFILLDMLCHLFLISLSAPYFIPLHFLCTHFWQLVHCNKLLPTPLQQTPHGHLTAFCLTFWRSPLIVTWVLFTFTLMLIVNKIHKIVATTVSK